MNCPLDIGPGMITLPIGDTITIPVRTLGVVACIEAASF